MSAVSNYQHEPRVKELRGMETQTGEHINRKVYKNDLFAS